MLRDTSAARTSSRSVTCARTPPGREKRAKKAAAEAMDRIGVFHTMGGRISPLRPVRKLLAPELSKHHIPSNWFSDAHRTDPAHYRHRAARNSRDHLRGWGLEREPAHRRWPPHGLHSAHFSFAVDPRECLARR